MSERDIKNFIRKEYGLNGNVKIRKINMDKMEFNILLGDCEATIPFGKVLRRHLKLENIGIYG